MKLKRTASSATRLSRSRVSFGILIRFSVWYIGLVTLNRNSHLFCCNEHTHKHPYTRSHTNQSTKHTQYNWICKFITSENRLPVHLLRVQFMCACRSSMRVRVCACVWVRMGCTMHVVCVCCYCRLLLFVSTELYSGFRFKMITIKQWNDGQTLEKHKHRYKGVFKQIYYNKRIP